MIFLVSNHSIYYIFVDNLRKRTITINQDEKTIKHLNFLVLNTWRSYKNDF